MSLSLKHNYCPTYPVPAEIRGHFSDVWEHTHELSNLPGRSQLAIAYVLTSEVLTAPFHSGYFSTSALWLTLRPYHQALSNTTLRLLSAFTRFAISCVFLLESDTSKTYCWNSLLVQATGSPLNVYSGMSNQSANITRIKQLGNREPAMFATVSSPKKTNTLLPLSSFGRVDSNCVKSAVYVQLS